MITGFVVVSVVTHWPVKAHWNQLLMASMNEPEDVDDAVSALAAVAHAANARPRRIERAKRLMMEFFH